MNLTDFTNIKDKKTISINLKDYLGKDCNVFSGRNSGTHLRNILKLNNLDNQENIIVEFNVSDKIYSINSGFFLNLFGNSIRKLGKKEFENKYLFIGENTVVIKRMKSYINDAL